MELGDSIPYSQGLSNNSYPEPNQPNPRTDIYFFNINSNIVLPSTTERSYRFLLTRINQIPRTDTYLFDFHSYIALPSSPRHF